MADKKQAPARDVFETALDDDEYDRLDKQYANSKSTSKAAQDALAHQMAQTPEGQAQREDMIRGMIAGGALFLGQRGLRALKRGRLKEFTGIGALTGPGSALWGGGLNMLTNAEIRRQTRAGRKKK